MISPSSEERVAEVREAIARLVRVDECLCLGVIE
jgi:hypothetical protein